MIILAALLALVLICVYCVWWVAVLFIALAILIVKSAMGIARRCFARHGERAYM